MKFNFVKTNQGKYEEFMQTVKSGDNKLAYRLIHTLKSNAGQIGEKRLQEAAAALEVMLADEHPQSGQQDGAEGRTSLLLDEKKTNLLQAELNLVLDNLAPLLTEFGKKRKTEIADAETIREIIGKLEPMLTSRNPECVGLIDDVLTIPGAEVLAQQIEKLKFKQALEELAKIKKTLE